MSDVEANRKTSDYITEAALWAILANYARKEDDRVKEFVGIDNLIGLSVSWHTSHWKPSWEKGFFHREIRDHKGTVKGVTLMKSGQIYILILTSENEFIDRLLTDTVLG